MLVNGRIELGTGTSGGSRVSVLHTKNLDINSEGLIIDLTYFDSGNNFTLSAKLTESLMSGTIYRLQLILLLCQLLRVH